MISRIITAFISATSFLLLSSCEKQYKTHPEIEILDGKFITPLGEFDIKLLSSVNEKYESEQNKRHRDNFTLYASDGVVTLNFATNHNLGENYIRYDMDLGKTLEFVSITYFMDKEAHAISFNTPNKKGYGYYSDRPNYQKEVVEKRRLAKLEPIKHESYYFSINYPPSLQSHLDTVDAESYKKHSSRVHEIEMKFLIDEQTYLLKVKYKHLLIRTSYYPAPYGGVSP